MIMIQWMLKLLYTYTWKVFRFKPSFCYSFWNLEFEEISMRFTMKIDFLKYSKPFQELLLLTESKWQDIVGKSLGLCEKNML